MRVAEETDGRKLIGKARHRVELVLVQVLGDVVDRALGAAEHDREAGVLLLQQVEEEAFLQ